MEIVIDTCILEDTSRGIIEAMEFIEFVWPKISNCELCLCVDKDGKIISEYYQKIDNNSYGAQLIQIAINFKKFKAIKANISHSVCQKVKKLSSDLDGHDLTFLAVTIKTTTKKFFTNDTGFYEPVGKNSIRRDSEGKPIPLEPIRKAGLLLFDVQSWQKGF